jgi:putative membrane protein insertion efficiency factor
MNPLKWILLGALGAYRYVVSPIKNAFFGELGRCRFTPSCSQYAFQAIAEHGPCAGSWLGLKRLCRCHPWGGCGIDPVPKSPKNLEIVAAK